VDGFRRDGEARMAGRLVGGEGGVDTGSEASAPASWRFMTVLGEVSVAKIVLAVDGFMDVCNSMIRGKAPKTLPIKGLLIVWRGDPRWLLP
jgi:hypothetical protein